MEHLRSFIREHIGRARQANTHPAKLLVLASLLNELFDVEIQELIPGIEKKLGSKILGIKGSADLLFSNIIIEIKVDLQRELDDAKSKLTKYIEVLHEGEPERKHIGIATDALAFKAFLPVLKNGKVINLAEISSINLTETPVPESILWLDSFIFSKPKVRPSAQDLKFRLGAGSPTYSLAIDSLTAFWHGVEKEKDVMLKLDLWARSMEIVYNSKPVVTAFIDHTYLVTLVKLIVYLRLSGDYTVKKEGIQRALTGEYFSAYGISNLIEEDFFLWLLHPHIANEALKTVCDIAKQLLRYDLSQIDEDFFKEIYQNIVERGQRHRIGEYYTPEWLTELTLQEALSLREDDSRFPAILDPACGSGTFLCNAIHEAKDVFQAQDEGSEDTLDWITNNIVGIDINPLAVVVARANYLMALGDLLRLGKPLTIPIWVADSIRLPEMSHVYTDVYGISIEAEGARKAKARSIQIPVSVAHDGGLLAGVIRALTEAIASYRERKVPSEAVEVFRRVAPSLSPQEMFALELTLDTILTLIDKNLNAIWVFMLSNVYIPVTLSNRKFDLIVGNPPWIGMRYVENANYQDFLKGLTLNYNLLEKDQAHLFTILDSSTVFFCRSVDLYLRDGGIIAFVMPRSVLIGAAQHTNFKEFQYPRQALKKILDLEDVSPLFNVPSCILLAVKDGETQYPVAAQRYKGDLPEKNIKLIEAKRHLVVSDYLYEAPVVPRYSHYYEHIKAGAAIYPRCFYFVDFDVQPVLGAIDVSRPTVMTSEDLTEKEPWKGITLRDAVEANFIYATLLGADLIPFGCRRLRPVVLPLKEIDGAYQLLDSRALRGKGEVHMAGWLEAIQRYWEARRTQKAVKNFPTVQSSMDYQKLLTSQQPHVSYMLIWNTHGTNLASCVIGKKQLPPFSVGKARVLPTSFIAEKVTHFYETDDKDEAHYLCAVLNSEVLNEAIKRLQPRGLWGERHITRIPFTFPIPKFNANVPLHKDLSKLSKLCHDKVSRLTFAKKSVGYIRTEARKAVSQELGQINEIVTKLLGI